MPGNTEALVVDMASWAAAAAAVCVLCSLLRAKRAGSAVAALVVAVGATIGGVASADSPHPHPSARPSLAWTASGIHQRAASDVVVRAGDCLWAITERELRDPSAARVSARWPSWWRTNRRVIGSDPNLIHPGQRLRRPEPLPWRH